ncbi:hypothetical protein C8A05DRAFT_34938 [Staphylotrichum tortipilum]|uniref:Uncharacterized protein n=1 Tax=Staphylotrichum tortipilum TaxID=2831512 RepID=A0AAN6MIA3_9PEZI|nr:hypothetical protein C8A05DRAFT_34938 [Staphylotrichum longicolle]
MKTSAIFSILALAASAIASPLAAEAETLEKRSCPSAAIIACQNACSSVVVNACANIGCNGNPSCLSACQSARRSQCISCCSSRCTTC